ncbi:MAG: hypothetical protein ACI9QD_000944 [Thermoproteota archaeon]|jgi:hypothetical protein
MEINLNENSNAQGTAQVSIKDWIESFIITLNICPFAKAPFENDTIRYSQSNAVLDKENFEYFLSEMNLIQSSKSDIINTSILVFPNIKMDFETFHDYSIECDDLLYELKLESHFQIVCFHPEFKFEGTEEDQPINFVNRSPYPFLHIIRTEEISMVTDSPTMGEEMNFANEQKLNTFTLEKLNEFIKKSS